MKPRSEKPKIKTVSGPALKLGAATCPAGSRKCSYESDRFLVEFKQVILNPGQLLPGPRSKTHRILFLITGSLHVCINQRDNHYLGGGQCIFLIRDCICDVQAEDTCSLVLLDFSNRLVFCHHDVLTAVAGKGGIKGAHSPVLPIEPMISSFLKNLQEGLQAKPLNIPCYHLIKEHELCILMCYVYGNRRLSGFFRNMLRAQDDFQLFIQSSYRNAESIAELARMANLSESSFKRKFRETFHETYHQWRVKQKEADIVKALQDGIRENEELMRVAGFNNYLSFYRFCQRYMNGSPALLKAKYQVSVE